MCPLPQVYTGVLGSARAHFGRK